MTVAALIAHLQTLEPENLFAIETGEETLYLELPMLVEDNANQLLRLDLTADCEADAAEIDAAVARMQEVLEVAK